MTANGDNGKQHDPLLYDFFRQEQWLERLQSVEDLTSSNFKLWRTLLQTLDGVTVGRFARLLRDAGADDYLAAVAQLEQAETAANYDLLIQQLRNHAAQRAYRHLNGLLATLLQNRRLPVAPDTPPAAALDLDFELKQLLNLYTLNHNLYNFAAVKLYAAVKALSFTDGTAAALPPVYLLRECFRHVALDAEIMQRAIVQRRREREGNGRYQIGPHARALLVTDKLALLALAPVAHLLPGHPRLNPITYFSHSTSIRRVPYSAGAILVGIRYDVVTLQINRVAAAPLPAFELMAIPHEVGHYVYHHARLAGGTTFAGLSAQFADNPYAHWCEELFADCYGCVVAGPLTGLGLQALLAYSDAHALEEADGEHPTPLVRPFLLSEILRVLSAQGRPEYRFLTVAQRLDENWARILERHGYALTTPDAGDAACQITRRADPDFTPIDFARLRADVRPIIETFVQQLLAHVRAAPWGDVDPGALSPEIPWSRGSHDDDLTKYDAEMAALTTRAFALKKAPRHTLIDSEQSRQKTLQAFLDNWGHSGPTGSSGGTHVST